MISIVVPCYNEEKSLPFFYKEYKKTIGQMKFDTFELLLIDDGSSDNTLRFIKDIAENDSSVRFISFSRNFGKEGAIYAGLEHSRGEYVVLMDADLQDPPELLPKMYEMLINEGVESVATRRVSRKGEPIIRSFFARRFYSIMKKVAKIEVVDGARDYRLMSRKFVNAILSLGEYNRFSKGLFGWVGFKTKWIEYENVERVAGETKWSFWKLFLYAIEGIVAFSVTPLQLSAAIGSFMSLLSFLFLVVIIVRKLIFGDPVAGWASTISIIIFLSGLQMFSIGVLGEYIAKLYTEVKYRPKYIIAETNEDKRF